MWFRFYPIAHFHVKLKEWKYEKQHSCIHACSPASTAVVMQLMKWYLDFLWEGCAEHHGLANAFGRHGVLLHDASDLRLEAHVQHAVGLVQDQEAEHKQIPTLVFKK